MRTGEAAAVVYEPFVVSVGALGAPGVGVGVSVKSVAVSSVSCPGMRARLWPAGTSGAGVPGMSS